MPNSQETSVVVADGGPGTGRLVNGLADAISDRAPVLAITGRGDHFLGTGYKQHINQQQLLMRLLSDPRI